METQARGTLTSTTPFVYSMDRVAFPCTVSLNSVAASRKIEVSTDGVNYTTPPLDASMTGQVLLVVNRRVSFIRLTGAAADTWSIV